MAEAHFYVLPRICPRDGSTRLIKDYSGGIATVHCPRCGYHKNQTGKEWFDDTDLYPLATLFPETPSDEKHCPLCDSKLLIHTKSPRRQIVYCSNPRCGYKNEL